MLALFTSTLLHFLLDTRLQAFFDGKKLLFSSLMRGEFFLNVGEITNFKLILKMKHALSRKCSQQRSNKKFCFEKNRFCFTTFSEASRHSSTSTFLTSAYNSRFLKNTLYDPSGRKSQKGHFSNFQTQNFYSEKKLSS